jgi:hypothetical protein
MKPETIDNTYLYRNAELGLFGTRVLPEGSTSHEKHEFLRVTALQKSVINYEKVVTDLKTYGDSKVVGLTLELGLSVNLGVVKNVHVQSGEVLGNLINLPK